MQRLFTLLGQYVVIPVLGLVLRVLTPLLGGPKVDGMKFVSCVGDTEELQPRVGRGAATCGAGGPNSTAPAWKAWRVVMVMDLPPVMGPGGCHKARARIVRTRLSQRDSLGDSLDDRRPGESC